MKKRILGIVIAVMFCFVFSVVSYADGTTGDSKVNGQRYAITQAAVSELAITGTTATCNSSAIGYSSVTKISAVQTLEKHWAFGLFFAVDGATWVKTVYTSTILMQNTLSGLSSGNYRLKTDFTITTANGQSETITVYSKEIIIS